MVCSKCNHIDLAGIQQCRFCVMRCCIRKQLPVRDRTVVESSAMLHHPRSRFSEEHFGRRLTESLRIVSSRTDGISASLRGARWAMLECVEVTLFRRKPLASPKITLFSPRIFHVTLSSSLFQCCPAGILSYTPAYVSQAFPC
jgi:hypothetical protein